MSACISCSRGNYVFAVPVRVGHRRKGQNDRCFEFITTCLAVLRYNHRHECETSGTSSQRIATATATADIVSI
jgi:hypothetical protein